MQTEEYGALDAEMIRAINASLEAFKAEEDLRKQDQEKVQKAVEANLEAYKALQRQQEEDVKNAIAKSLQSYDSRFEQALAESLRLFQTSAQQHHNAALQGAGDIDAEEEEAGMNIHDTPKRPSVFHTPQNIPVHNSLHTPKREQCRKCAELPAAGAECTSCQNVKIV